MNKKPKTKTSTIGKQTIGKQGHAINSQAREIIASLIRFMEMDAAGQIDIPKSAVKHRVMAATGIGEAAYYKIKREQSNKVKAVICTCPDPLEINEEIIIVKHEQES